MAINIEEIEEILLGWNIEDMSYAYLTRDVPPNPPNLTEEPNHQPFEYISKTVSVNSWTGSTGSSQNRTNEAASTDQTELKPNQHKIYWLMFRCKSIYSVQSKLVGCAICMPWGRCSIDSSVLKPNPKRGGTSPYYLISLLQALGKKRKDLTDQIEVMQSMLSKIYK
jgi:hypothetical protein